MRDPDDTQAVDELRSGLHALVDDVEPRGDTLPRLLAARQRRSRRPSRRPLIAAGGVAVAASAVFLVALAVVPGTSPRQAEPVSIAPNSYVAAPKPGTLASFDVLTGKQHEVLAEVGAPVQGGLAADGDRVYATVPAAGGSDIVVLGPDRIIRPVAHRTGTGTALAAGGGRFAYAEGDGVVVEGTGGPRRIGLPAGEQALDLAVDHDGRLAVLTSRSEIHIVAPGGTELGAPMPTPPAGACAPQALAWSDSDVAVLTPAECGNPPAERMRISTLDGDSGAAVGGGVPFDTGGALGAEQVQLSVDRVGRYLVSVADGRQWLVDGADARPVAPACADTGCVPATFWG
ncbi:hypothetical protein OOZ19_15055 [Saccharopolyspora sp. NFXS83]|uniref:hypothetical protein n=1 Tax=Saccharopolyspora sp. NFXS83 TaxID=2993560 RepID=UPI00224AD4C7|nr:hypothetical protein [Saccharopolyspora sp. NFXS83]MCX2731561.1 hypothetical protein [Saccharopolyspora sp. NFXS83]